MFWFLLTLAVAVIAFVFWVYFKIKIIKQQRKVQALKNQVRILNIEISEKKLDITQNDLSLKHYREDVKNKNAEIEKYKEDVKNKNAEIEKYKTEIQCKKKSEIIMHKEYMDLKGEIEKYKTEIQNKNAEIEKYKKEIQYKKKIEVIMNKEYKDLKGELESLDDKYDFILSDNKILDEDNRRLRQDNKKLQADNRFFVKKLNKNSAYQHSGSYYALKLLNACSNAAPVPAVQDEQEHAEEYFQRERFNLIRKP